MDRDRLVMGLAAVFAGITMLIVVLAFAYQPFLLVMAIPFGATTYFMYAHVSGRLEDRFYQERIRMNDGRIGFQADGNGATRRETGGFGAGPRGDPREGPGAGRFGGLGGQTSQRERYQRVRPPRRGLTRSEALRTLGLDDGASSEDVKRAYRERVKETHPDSKTGDEESFKRVTRAYERLSE
ncbi:J domain-containing protein [Haloferax sp. DFSO52]|uniref:J domain-containing protein n=1 Tax=Haloferax sp. DFSO52 TaxID=3388505 RepID=UPI003A84B9A4